VRRFPADRLTPARRSSRSLQFTLRGGSIKEFTLRASNSLNHAPLTGLQAFHLVFVDCLRLDMRLRS
jgi:hypothetical protein